MTGPMTAIILAGSRPGSDPLLAGTGLASKALLPVGGQPMLAHVLEALRAAPEVGRIIVLAQRAEELRTLGSWGSASGVEWRDSGSGISASLRQLLAAERGPVLVTTADNVLITPAMIAHFLAARGDADVAAAMVERQVLLAAYPESRRTWLKFRDGWWSGANLFWFGGPQVAPLLDFWSGIEADRKKGWRIIGAFGPWLLAGVALRLIGIHDGVRRAGRRFGLDARIVPMPQPEACIDADKPEDIALIEAIMARRG